jgi:hypothetical protein
VAAGRSFRECRICRALSVNPEFIPTKENELIRYTSHNNFGKGYSEYISKHIKIIKPYIKAHHDHLDYGCGPNPELGKQLSGIVASSTSYDPFFYDVDYKNKKYDLITCIETAEHFHQPLREFHHLFDLLSSTGRIIVITNMYSGTFDPHWWYLRDSTHTVFYHNESVKAIAGLLDASYELISNRGFVIGKS